MARLIADRLPENIDTYYEPFVGSAAVFFTLASQGRFRRAVLSDRNQELIDVYRALKRSARAVVKLLAAYPYDRDFYYELRAVDPKTLELEARAARTIYLNRTGFNGLYRVNRSGQFNVPFGRYVNPTICDERRLLEAAELLKRAKLQTADFEAACANSRAGDAVYFDPPYVPLSRTSNFTAYHHEAFGDEEHERLAKLFGRLSERQVRAVLSNSDTPRTQQLYRPWQVEKLLVGRPINSKPTQRGNVGELLVCNVPQLRARAKSGSAKQ